jgi:hypothetical protein
MVYRQSYVTPSLLGTERGLSAATSMPPAASGMGRSGNNDPGHGQVSVSAWLEGQ